MKVLKFILLFFIHFQNSLQDCPKQVSYNGLSVIWRQTPNAIDVESEPVCYHDGGILKRNCTDDEWLPALNDLKPCQRALNGFHHKGCPPGFRKISETNNDYCYVISKPSVWNYPCFASGGASIITDFDEKELNELIDSLIKTNISRYFWLPAQRQKLFNPVVWFIPGPNWGQQIKSNDYIPYNNLFWKNCLALDVQQRKLVTEACTERYPSLCFYINNLHYPASCPKNYYAFRYKPDDGTCFGIEYSYPERGWTFNQFLTNKCKTPMKDDSGNDFNRFIFTKIAEFNNLTNDHWCWFETAIDVDDKYVNTIDKQMLLGLQGIVNNIGTLGLINSTSSLPCMACEKEVIYGETELMFEYNDVENKLYLTIYFPSGLWKYDNDDKGVQCFSDAKGFVKVIHINDIPYMLVEPTENYGNQIEKVVYAIELVTDRSAQYWCEGHTFNFSLISTNKMVINPNGKDMHVFSLVLNYHNITNDIEDMPDISNLLQYVTDALNVENVLLMDIYDITSEYITVLLHVHVSVVIISDNEALNILETFDRLERKSVDNLPLLNSTFVNLTSSVYCLPTTSNGTIYLDWELTPVGHISAPKQFCLQSNGLPVKRRCTGTYHSGGQWGPIEGTCDTNYIPSNTTTLLYNIIKGQTPSDYTTNFITFTLGIVLSDVDIIIPADIYYLSMSLQQFLEIAQKNETSVDMGDIYNIAWVMDRVMDLDCDYLRLAQTLNSTNVILNSVSDIIEIIAKSNENETKINSNEILEESRIMPVDNIWYQLAVKPQFIVQISYPVKNNITGIAISKLSESDSFNNMLIRPLYLNTTLDEVMTIDNLEIATWLPTQLLNVLKKNGNDSTDDSDQNNDELHIIISVYKNDVVFQELYKTDHAINSRIVGVSIPGYESNLRYPLPLIFKQLNNTDAKRSCGYWDFKTEISSQQSGHWRTKGCRPVNTTNDGIMVCECYHLTHFSQLISYPGYLHMNPEKMIRHVKALNAITLIGCFLSLMGIIGIWTTACVFSNWRKKAGTKVLLQLSVSLALPLLLIIISNLDNTIFIIEDDVYVVDEAMKPVCIIIGALLHYSILASFMWMLITAVLQFIRYVRVLGVSRPSRFLFKFACIGWGIPFIPVIIVISIDVDNYVPSASVCKSICYPKGAYFILSVMVPICIILFVNVVLFISVLHSISRGSNEKMKSTDMDLIGAQLRLSIFLFFLLGLTWVFGIFSFTKTLIWSYLFCLTATLQGFVLFIYFIICDPATRSMWITLVKPPFSSSTSRNSISSSF